MAADADSVRLARLCSGLRQSRGLAGKRDIAHALAALGDTTVPGAPAVANGDDAAAITDGEGWLLFAIEGFIQEFVAADPWFAGWCGVMVNCSDIAAMGGRPMAVVDAVWAADSLQLAPVMEGMAAAARAFGVPVVGGHSNSRAGGLQLAVAVLGRAAALLPGSAARPGDALMVAIDLRGGYRGVFPHWDAATDAPSARLQGDLALLPELAEAGLCRAARDISQAGALGSALMLLEAAGCGAEIAIDAVPRPSSTDAERWLLEAFPSFGYVLAVPPEQEGAVAARFAERDIACATVGCCTAQPVLRLSAGDARRVAWDLAREPVLGLAPNTIPQQRTNHA
ncbi:sll0787 family AIR synthase-like protein [Algiphilus aromaticivorans]|uniref:sll0787 family AIR synthase-like protein n=1 Tax=Algiphilus aromaticivorans TaxID=382454 RepID=UPI0005C262E2|nr:sll0787 family AIR synthase-like protein [Algiphilus aromaticivorans]